MISCYLIDDDYRSMEILEEYISHVKHLQVVFRSHTATDLIAHLPGLPEKALIFLDINMPGLSGMELAGLIPEGPALVFTTAHTEFAALAFDVAATDYLIKPFSNQRFLKAVTRATNKFHPPLLQEHDEEFVYLKINKTLRKIFYQDILYLEAMENYVHVHTHEKRITVHQTLKAVLKDLPDEQFVQINRFHIVNVKKISQLTLSHVLLENLQQLKLSPRFKNRLTNIYWRSRDE